MTESDKNICWLFTQILDNTVQVSNYCKIDINEEISDFNLEDSVISKIYHIHL